MRERRLSIGRRIAAIPKSPYTNDYTNCPQFRRDCVGRIKLMPIDPSSNRTLNHFFGQQKDPAACARPSTRKETRARRSRLQPACEDPFQPTESSFVKQPATARLNVLPRVRNAEKEDINPNSGDFRVVVTRGQPAAAASGEFLGDYQSNMNLFNYDFNKQKRLSTSVSQNRGHLAKSMKHNPNVKANTNENDDDGDDAAKGCVCEKEGANLLGYYKRAMNRGLAKRLHVLSESPHRNCEDQGEEAPDSYLCRPRPDVIRRRVGNNFRCSLANSGGMARCNRREEMGRRGVEQI